MTLSQGGRSLGTLRLILATDTVPKTCQNFLALLRSSRDGGGDGYLNSPFHRIIKGFMAQGGDFTRGDGTGGRSIYGDAFADENFVLSHDGRGVLSMANSGPGTNGSQFFLTFRSIPHLDGRHVVFGRVDLADPESAAALEGLERVATGKDDRPRVPVTVVDCGVEGEAPEPGPDPEPSVPASVAMAEDDDDEIDLDDLDDDVDDDDDDDDDSDDEEKADGDGDDGGGDNSKGASEGASPAVVRPEADEIDPDEDQEDENPPPKGSKAALQARLRKLKMKMNQSRRLNRREVQSEGERLGSEEGAKQHRRRQAREDRDRRRKEWGEMTSRSVEGAAAAADGVAAKKLTEQASDVMRKAQRKADRAASNRYEVGDTHNPEGQQRNYERSVRSVPRGATSGPASSSTTYDPSQIDGGGGGGGDASAEREGAKRLANELRRRAAKTAERRKRKDVEFDAADVSGINKRNKRFNEKIGRNFDPHTADIRQNLERGTAL